MVSYSWPRVKDEKMVNNTYCLHLFFDFYIDPGGPWGHPGGSGTDSGAGFCFDLNIYDIFHSSIVLFMFLIIEDAPRGRTTARPLLVNGHGLGSRPSCLTIADKHLWRILKLGKDLA